MREFVKEREGPRGPRVRVVYDDERSDAICQGEAAERFKVDRSVVTPKIANQENKHPRSLRSIAK